METRLDVAEIKIFVKPVKDKDSFIGKATVSIRGKYTINGEIVNGAMEIGGFRIWKKFNDRTGLEYRVSPPSYKAGSFGYKPYFFSFAFGETEQEKKKLWYLLEDLIISEFEEQTLIEKDSGNEKTEEVDLSDIPF